MCLKTCSNIPSSAQWPTSICMLGTLISYWVFFRVPRWKALVPVNLLPQPFSLQKTPMKIVEEEEEEVADIKPDPLHQLILHFSHNALTERRSAPTGWLILKTQNLLISLSDVSFQPLGSRSFVYCICRHDGKGTRVVSRYFLSDLHEQTFFEESWSFARAVRRTRRKRKKKGKRRHLRCSSSNCQVWPRQLCQVKWCKRVSGTQEKEMEKQKILYQQARLHARGAAEMVLQMIGASKGDRKVLPHLKCYCFPQHRSM